MQKKILVVEDDRIIAENIKMTLTTMGYAVTSVVTTGEEAIEEIKKDSPHLILMDIVLRGVMDGIATADHIRNHFTIPVIYLTAYSDQETIERAKKTGPFGYLLKPFSERELFITIETALYRHEMEQKIQESEERYHTLVEQATDGIAIIRDSVFLFVNPRLVDITGYTVDEVVGSSLATYLHPDHRSVLMHLHGSAAGKQPFMQETVLLRKDGQEIHVEFNAQKIDYEGAPANLVIMRDISQRKAMEQELQRKTSDLEQTNKQLQMLQTISNALNATMDQTQIATIITQAIAHTFDFFSPLIFTFSRDKKFLKLTPSPLPESIEKFMEKTMEKTTIHHIYHHTIPVTHTPLQNLMQSKEPLVTSDPEQFLQLFGTDPHIINMGLPLIEALQLHHLVAIPLVTDDTPLGILVMGSDHPVSEKNITDVEGFLEQAILALSKAQLYEKLQKAHKKLMEMTNTLERKVVSRTAQLTQANKLKSDFLASMSHEFRTPLNSILSFTDILLLGLDGTITAAQREDLTLIKESGRDLLALVNNILDLSKIEAGELALQVSTVDPHEIIDAVISQLMVKAVEKGIDLRSSISSSIPHITADETRLKQILRNLIVNAIKFTEKGEVVVGAELHSSKHPPTMLFWVRDTGIGIQKKNLTTIFEKFTQASLDGIIPGGTGLGLSVCKELVELHDGKIWVESTVGEGSTFFFTIPSKKCSE
jgi:PAS domain S-box-containing protein